MNGQEYNHDTQPNIFEDYSHPSNNNNHNHNHNHHLNKQCTNDATASLTADTDDGTTVTTTHAAAANKKCKKQPVLVSRKTCRERWTVLALCCLLMGGNHFCCDQPASLYAQFDDHMNEKSSTFENYFNLLYTMYSVPNIFLPLVGGGMVDKYGAWQSLIVFTSFMVLGQFVFALGVQNKSWAVMLLGRTLFGVGGESLYTAKSVLITNWFPDNQIALAFGFGMSIGRLGTVISNVTSPPMANGVDLSFAIWVGFLVSVLVFLASVYVGVLERRLDQRLLGAAAASQRKKKVNGNGALQNALLEDDHLQAIGEDTAEDSSAVDEVQTRKRADSVASECSLHIEHSHSGGLVNIRDALKFSLLFWAITASSFFVYGSVFPFNFVSGGILLERDYFKDPPDTCTLRFENKCTGGTLAPESGNPSTDENGDECPGSNDAPVLPSSLNITKDNTEWNDDWEEDEYVFEDLSSDDVTCADDFWAEACTKNYCDDQDDATEFVGIIMSIPFFMGALFSAPIGHLSDKHGYRALSCMISPIFLICAHFQLAYSPEGPIFPLILQGLAFCVYCAIIW